MEPISIGLIIAGAIGFFGGLIVSSESSPPAPEPALIWHIFQQGFDWGIFLQVVGIALTAVGIGVSIYHYKRIRQKNKQPDNGGESK